LRRLFQMLGRRKDSQSNESYEFGSDDAPIARSTPDATKNEK
jgi:hypothetical protein